MEFNIAKKEYNKQILAHIIIGTNVYKQLKCKVNLSKNLIEKYKKELFSFFSSEFFFGYVGAYFIVRNNKNIILPNRVIGNLNNNSWRVIYFEYRISFF